MKTSKMYGRTLKLDLTFALTATVLFVFMFIILYTLFTSTSIGELKLVLTSQAMLSALAISLKTSLIVILLTFIVGFPVAFLLATKEFFGKTLLDALIDLPIVMPPMVMGVALLALFSKSNLGNHVIFTQNGIILAQFLVASPFFIKTVRESIALIPDNLFEAAASLRTRSLFTLLKVVIPLSKNAIIAGLILTWARALGEFGATSMVAGNIPFKTETLTLSIYTNALGGNLSMASGIAFLLAVFSLIFLAIFKLIFLKRYGY